MDDRDIRRTDDDARRGFNYEGDGVFDTWRSHADEIGQGWSGDCDDLASTVLDLLGRAGVPLDHRFHLAVDSCAGGKIDHLVGVVISDEGSFLIVGDTFGSAYNARGMGHRPIQYHRLDEWTAEGKAVWRDGAPWA